LRNEADDPVIPYGLAAKDRPADYSRKEETPRTIASQSGSRRKDAVYRTVTPLAKRTPACISGRESGSRLAPGSARDSNLRPYVFVECMAFML
jgi:hypothetical protein